MGRRSTHRLRAVGTGVAEAVPRYNRLRVEQRLMAHCVTAYHATCAFMTMKTPATTRTTAMPTLPRLLRKRDSCKLGCDDMRIAEIRDRAPLRSKLLPIGSAATASQKWSSTSCRTYRDSDRSKLSAPASDSRWSQITLASSMGGFLRGHRRWHWKIAARRRSGRRARAHLAGSTRRLASVARIRRPPSDWQVGWPARDDAAWDSARRSRQSRGQGRATLEAILTRIEAPGICRSCRSGAP
jgi:hypothetical protein